MTIKILDYNGKSTEVDIGDLSNVGAINMRIVTGDEILTVIHKDYTVDEYDSANDRSVDFYDGGYTVYNSDEGINLLENEDWLSRKTSYYTDF